MQTHTELPKKSGLESSRELQTHPFVERLKPEPDQPPRQVTVLTGLPGESDRDGYYRFYLNAKLDYYAECRIVDLVYVETISPEQSPFDGLEATRASILRDATIYYIWARTPQPVDELDLTARLGASTGLGPMLPYRAPVPPGLAPDFRPALRALPALVGVGNSLGPGGTLYPDQVITSFPTGRCWLWYQGDGNLVLYDMVAPRVCWASNTMNSGSDRCVMQDDGNLVIYAGSTPVWASGTAGNEGSSLTVQEDGRVVINSRVGLSTWARP